MFFVPGQANAFALDSLFDYIYRDFDFLPQYHLTTDIFMFFNHKDSVFRQRYYLETNTNLELELLAFRDIVYSVWCFEFQTGMGQTPGNVVFDPMDINFGIVPAFEVRLQPLNIQAGLNHHCYHEIDRKDFPTVYLNKLFVAAGSKNMRLSDYFALLNQKDGWTVRNRISWYAAWSYYMRKFFGLVSETSINGINKNLLDVTIDARYAFYQRRSWILNLHAITAIGYWKSLQSEPQDDGAYWRLDLGLESNFRRGGKGGMIFLNVTLDDLPKYQGYPRFSKDRLLQLGVRFFI